MATPTAFDFTLFSPISSRYPAGANPPATRHNDAHWPRPRLIYHPRYNIRIFGFERLHPFDSRKYGRAWNALQKRFVAQHLKTFLVRPPRPVRRSELLELHTADYLNRLRDPKFLSRLLEIPPLRRLPGWLIDWAVLRPMRWATMGTVIAAREAMEHGLAVNLSGGYHHAMVVLSGGYSEQSYRLVAQVVEYILRTWGRMYSGQP